MKRLSCKIALVLVSGMIVLGLTGCAHLGETSAEASRRHHRVIELNTKELGEDIDTFFMMDKPSKLTDKQIY